MGKQLMKMDNTLLEIRTHVTIPRDSPLSALDDAAADAVEALRRHFPDSHIVAQIKREVMVSAPPEEERKHKRGSK